MFSGKAAVLAAAVAFLGVPAALADCVRSDIVEERLVASDFLVADFNRASSRYVPVPTFVRLCITGNDPDEKFDTDFLLFEIDTYGEAAYERLSLDVGDAPIALDAMQTFLRWHEIATERGDALERDILVDVEDRCRVVQWTEEHPGSSLYQYLGSMRSDCEDARANGYGMAYIYHQGVFLIESRNRFRQRAAAAVRPEHIPEFIRLTEAFISGEIYDTTMSDDELDAIYD